VEARQGAHGALRLNSPDAPKVGAALVN